MAKFKYKFETIQDVKERLEKKAQKELAVIEMDISNINSEISHLVELLKEHKQKKIEPKTKRVKEYHFDEKYESYLVEQIGILKKRISGLKIKRNAKLEELIKKSKETKTFEKLRENHFSDYVKTQDKLEQKEMDEFAVNEYLKEY